MKQTFETIEQALARVAEIDALMGFPDDTGTLTYAIPQLNEETEMWEIEVGSDVINNDNGQDNLESTEPVGDVAE